MVKKVLAHLHLINKSGILASAAIFGILSLSALAIVTPERTYATFFTSTNEAAPSRLFEKLNTESQLPALLSSKDKQLYRDIFSAQDNAKWKKADWLMAKLINKELLGHILAQRFLHEKYRSTAPQLEAWLEKYNDHPQTKRIYSLAQKKNPKLKLLHITTKRALGGYGDDNGLARWKSKSRSASVWDNAINAWRRQDTRQAARLFSSLAKNKRLHKWKIAASAFWAWRSYRALDNHKQAAKHLHIAANYPRTFYGVLARQKLGKELELDKSPALLSDSDILEIMGEKPIRRIISLSRMDKTDLADEEIRLLFPHANRLGKHRLLAIAGELNLASAQIAMARHLATQKQKLDFARYPIPDWQPHTGFRVDPALIYAMVRQESGFRNQAVSHAGAMGMMQLMPKTVSLMKKRVLKKQNHTPIMLNNAHEPTTNITLGQGYIEHLLDVPLVENNLFYLLTAYNAGPGRLLKWKKNINYRNDPLLFLESIPYGETRSYVMQVMTNYWIYSEMIGSPTRTHQALLQNRWPDYEPLGIPVASADTAKQAS